MSTSRNTLDLWRMDDSEDLETTTILHMFGITEALGFQGYADMIPAELEFRLGAGGWSLEGTTHEDAPWPDVEYDSRLADGTLTPDEAARALRLLHRYLRLVRRYQSEQENA